MKKYTLNQILETEKALELSNDELLVVEAILELRDYGEYNKDLKENEYTLEDLENAIDEINDITYYMSVDDYENAMDDLLEFSNPDSVEARYFDYDAYHRDCMYDVSEASNGVVLSDY